MMAETSTLDPVEDVVLSNEILSVTVLVPSRIAMTAWRFRVMGH